MENQYIWNIAEVVKGNSISEDQKLTRTFLVDGKYGTALVVQAQPQTEPFIHEHSEHDEFLYILEGEGWCYIGEKEFKVKPGYLIFCPAGMKHGFLIPVKGVRLSIYCPPFDREKPDRVVMDGNDLK